MQVIELNTEGLKRELKIVLPANDIDTKVAQKLDEVSKNIKLPGFRPGKVPVKVVKSRYGAAVVGEVLENEVRSSCEKAFKDKNIQPANQPEFDIPEYKEGKDLEYTIRLEVLPEIKFADFEKISVEKRVATTDEKEIKNTLDRISLDYSDLEPIKKKRAAKKGDVLSIDYVGKVGGVAFAGGTGNDYDLELGSNTFIPGFEDQLIGAKIDEDVAVEVSFPKSYHADELAGKKAVFDVKVKNISTKKAPKIDDALAKKIGFDSLKALKEDIAKHLDNQLSSISREEVKKDLLDKLADAHKFEVPESLKNGEFEAIWKQVEKDKEAGKLDEEDKKKTDKKLKADYEKIAERRVKLGLLLAEVGKVNNISVTQQEIQAELSKQLQHYPDDTKQRLLNLYKENPEMLANIKGPIFEDKVVDFVLSKVKVKEKKVSADELMKQ